MTEDSRSKFGISIKMGASNTKPHSSPMLASANRNIRQIKRSAVSQGTASAVPKARKRKRGFSR
jgi:hypothetical protein